MSVVDLSPRDPFLAALFKQPARRGRTVQQLQDDKIIMAQASRSQRSRGVSGSMTARGAVRNAYGVSQAVVKITRQGRTMGGNALRNQFQYVSRGGETQLEGQGGEVFDPGKTGRHGELARDWQHDFDLMDKRTTAYTYHLVVSYPAGTDPVAAELAATEFAHELTGGRFGDQWKFALAHHRDTQFPHSHLILNRRGTGGGTLHLSRTAISIQDLRELHVETSGNYGILLNATSRFSRNVDVKPQSSGRIHAEREGRPLPQIEKSRMTDSRFPGYGAAMRADLNERVLEDAQERLANEYRNIAKLFGEQSPNTDGGLLGQLDQAAYLIANDQQLTREGLTMANETAVQTPGDTRTAVQASDQQLQRINENLREIYRRTRDNIDRVDDEAKKTEAEKSLARIMKEYDPFIDDKVRAEFGRGLEREDFQAVDQKDQNPIRQRVAASREAEEQGADRDKPVDDRTAKALERLERADAQVKAMFKERGLNAELAMQRILDAPNVDLQTRDNWMQRDVEGFARVANVSEKQARDTMQKAFKDAASLYQQAREDIRGIKRGEDRSTQSRSSEIRSKSRGRGGDLDR